MADDDQAPFEGTEDQAARAAAVELEDRRRAHDVPVVDQYLRGAHNEEIKMSDAAAKANRSNNPNVEGPDAKRVAEALAKYRDVRQHNIDADLVATYGRNTDGTPLPPGPDDAVQAQHAPPQHPPEVAQALAHAQQQTAQAREQAIQMQTVLFNQQFGPIIAEFQDVQTQADVAALAAHDPQRFVRFQAAKEAIAAASGEIQAYAAQQQQAEQWDNWARQEDAKFAASAPELADPGERQKVAADVVRIASQTYGVTPAELAFHYQNNPVMRSAPFQRMMLDVVKYHRALAEGRKPSSKPVPSVQRPGARRPAGSDAADAEFEHLKDLEKSGSMRDAAKLLIARRNRD